MPKLFLSAVKAAGYDADTLARAVEDYRQALLAHRFIGDARPVPSEAWMESLVKRVQYPIADQKPDEFVSDYEVVDDTPPPPTLKERKMALAMTVAQMERDALDAILPPGKTRLLHIRLNDALVQPEDQRSALDSASIAAYEQWRLSCDQVSRKAAELMAEVDDLTEATVGSWKPSPINI